MRVNSVFALIAALAVTVATTSLHIFRYEHHVMPTGFMIRIDRLTGIVCAYPTYMHVRTALEQTSDLEICPTR